MKTFLKVVGALLLIIFIIAGAGVFYMTRGINDVKGTEINDVNGSNLENGIYKGSYHVGRWSNEVEVEVKDGIIKKIEFVEDVRFSMDDVRKELIKKVLDKQSTDVDIVSGATVTSKAYLKSIENALSP